MYRYSFRDWMLKKARLFLLFVNKLIMGLLIIYLMFLSIIGICVQLDLDLQQLIIYSLFMDKWSMCYESMPLSWNW